MEVSSGRATVCRAHKPVRARPQDVAGPLNNSAGPTKTTRRAMNEDKTPALYRTSRLQRGLSLLSVGALLLLAVLEATDEGPLLELSLVNVMLTGATLLAAAG